MVTAATISIEPIENKVSFLKGLYMRVNARISIKQLLKRGLYEVMKEEVELVLAKIPMKSSVTS
jgi:hypothetical protein